MKILIIGGTRFIGKEVVNGLKFLKSNYTVFSRNVSFKNEENYIIGDRNNLEDLKKIIGKFDVIIDFISYSANQTKNILNLFPDTRYIMISTSWKKTKDPLSNQNKSNYIQNKRLAELEIKKSKNVQNRIIRLPIVLGLEDHTGRSYFFKQKDKLKPKIVYTTNPEIEICFCWKTEVVEFIINEIFEKNSSSSLISYPKSFYKMKLSELIKIYQSFEKKEYLFRSIDINRMKEDSQFKQYLKNIGEDFYFPIEIFGKSYMNIEKTNKLHTHIKKLYNCN